MQARVGESGETHGIDPAPEMIAVAQNKAMRSGACVNFRVGVIEDIPFPNDYFDVVLSSLTIHHLPDALKREGFVNIRRVLKPGGHLFIVDFEPPDNPAIRFLFTHILGHDMMKVNVQEYVPMMQRAGFADVEAGRTKSRYISFVKGSKSQTVFKAWRSSCTTRSQVNAVLTDLGYAVWRDGQWLESQLAEAIAEADNDTPSKVHLYIDARMWELIGE